MLSHRERANKKVDLKNALMKHKKGKTQAVETLLESEIHFF